MPKCVHKFMEAISKRLYIGVTNQILCLVILLMAMTERVQIGGMLLFENDVSLNMVEPKLNYK